MINWEKKYPALKVFNKLARPGLSTGLLLETNFLRNAHPGTHYRMAASLKQFFIDELHDADDLESLKTDLQDLIQLLTLGLEFITNSSSLKDVTYLMRWDGAGELERWRVVTERGVPVKIQQTVHQLQVTEKYVILMDTAFQFGIGQVMNNPIPANPGLERLLRVLITSPQLPDTILYIIRRADLQPGQKPAHSTKEVKVKAKKVTIPREAIHFLADYENPDDQIILHIGHVCTWEGAEWVRNYDRQAQNPDQEVPANIHGMISQEMDLNYIGRYCLDGKTGTLLEQSVIKDFTCTWGIAFFTHALHAQTGQIPTQLDTIYWTSLGLWSGMLTDFLFNLTKDYPYRTISPSDLLLYAQEGVPPCLFQVDTSASPIAITDTYQFPEGYMVNSIQFVPQKHSSESSKTGYIICTVFSPTDNQLWIFQGEHLASGPICQLSHPHLNFSFTTHTTWLPKIASRQTDYHIGVYPDYQPFVAKKKDPKIQQLFDEEVYPYFPEKGCRV